MVPSPRQADGALQSAMAAIRQARIAIRQASAALPIGVKLEGKPAIDRLDDVAELLHRYTAQLRRQADE